MSEPVKANTLNPRFAVLALLVLGAAMWRLLPYALPPDSPFRPIWNFAPITAIALFGGMMFANRWAALFIPLAALLCSDAILHLYQWAPLVHPADWVQKGVTYAIFAAAAVLGIALSGCFHRAPKSVAAAASPESRLLSAIRKIGIVGVGVVTCSVGFFLLSNFVVWLTVTESMPEEFRYAPTLAGLVECYVKAVPFFRGTLLGDAVFATVLFGGFALAELAVPALRRAEGLPAHPALAVASDVAAE